MGRGAADRAGRCSFLVLKTPERELLDQFSQVAEEQGVAASRRSCAPSAEPKMAIGTVSQTQKSYRCRTHFTRNILKVVPWGSADVVASTIRTTFAKHGGKQRQRKYHYGARTLASSNRLNGHRCQRRPAHFRLSPDFRGKTGGPGGRPVPKLGVNGAAMKPTLAPTWLMSSPSQANTGTPGRSRLSNTTSERAANRITPLRLPCSSRSLKTDPSTFPTRP